MSAVGWQFDYGMVVRDPATGDLVAAADLAASMDIPVICRCGQLFDMAAVKVTVRAADCSVFNTPCCDRTTDDRTWINNGLTRVTR